MNKERIESLRKAQTIKEYQKRGIDEKVADFKIKLSNPLGEMSFRELEKKVLSSLKRQIKRDLVALQTYEDLIAYVSKLNFSSSSAEFIEMSEDKVEGESMLAHVERFDNNLALLKSASKESIEDRVKVKGDITLPNYKGEYETYTAYGVLGVSLPKRYEGGSWQLTNRNMKSIKLMNLEDVLSKVFYYNTLEKYIVANKELYFKLVLYNLVGKENVEVKSEKDLYTAIEESNINKEWIDGLINDELIKKYLVPELTLEEDIVDNKLKAYKGDYLRYMLPEFLSVTNSVELKVEKDMSVYTTYARTFETKKHINKETLRAMKSNCFLNRYGYVEIDNSVDLDKFRKLSEEFRDLKRKIFIPEAEDHSFRIKRIGHYKANGIYFPDMKANVISVETPSSYIHELGHQLDYTFKEGRFPLSESFKFRGIMEEYRKLVREGVKELPVDDPFYKQWTGNSKANADYYLQPTEVFARCYELYVTHVLGIETSFAKSSYKGSPVYPLQDSLLEMIASYFDDMFSFFEPKIESESVADTFDILTAEIEEYTDVEQLSLF